jgi:hypothetical protein
LQPLLPSNHDDLTLGQTIGHLHFARASGAKFDLLALRHELGIRR